MEILQLPPGGLPFPFKLTEQAPPADHKHTTEAQAENLRQALAFYDSPRVYRRGSLWRERAGFEGTPKGTVLMFLRDLSPHNAQDKVMIEHGLVTHGLGKVDALCFHYDNNGRWSFVFCDKSLLEPVEV